MVKISLSPSGLFTPVPVGRALPKTIRPLEVPGKVA
jgi:hypothetical protein